VVREEGYVSLHEHWEIVEVQLFLVHSSVELLSSRELNYGGSQICQAQTNS
jgi:hypothetical protein